MRTNRNVHKDKYIVVRYDFVGYHKYENAPDEVAFLRNLHRHTFKVECTIQVHHKDRELEFFMVRNKLETMIQPFIAISELGSCEMIADEILEGLLNSYGEDRFMQVRVSEDGENDGIVQFSPRANID